MNAAAEIGRNPVSKNTRFSLTWIMSRLTRDGTSEPVSRDQILRRERGQGNLYFPCSADYVQDRQPYPVDSYSAIYYVTYISKPVRKKQLLHFAGAFKTTCREKISCLPSGVNVAIIRRNMREERKQTRIFIPRQAGATSCRLSSEEYQNEQLPTFPTNQGGRLHFWWTKHHPKNALVLISYSANFLLGGSK